MSHLEDNDSFHVLQRKKRVDDGPIASFPNAFDKMLIRADKQPISFFFFFLLSGQKILIQ